MGRCLELLIAVLSKYCQPRGILHAERSRDRFSLCWCGIMPPKDVSSSPVVEVCRPLGGQLPRSLSEDPEGRLMVYQAFAPTGILSATSVTKLGCSTEGVSGASLPPRKFRDVALRKWGCAGVG